MNPRHLPITDTVAIKNGVRLRVYTLRFDRPINVRTRLLFCLRWWTRVEHVTVEYRVQRAGTWLLRAGNNDRMLARLSSFLSPPPVLVSPLMDRSATIDPFDGDASGQDWISAVLHRTRSFLPSFLSRYNFFFFKESSPPISPFQFRTIT